MTTYEDDEQSPEKTAADDLAGDVRRGARRVKHAVREAVADGAEAVEDAVRPTFRERLVDAVKSVAEDPASTLQQVRDIVRDHPLASLTTIAIASAVVARALRR